ncbi:MAG: Bro-N domain-containing protein [Clostridia bacterium]|nr:Bro-N domain-containing protein [Clostridia bacterium]
MESKELKVFNYLNNEVRVVTKESEPWFVAADVCKVLEIDQVTNAIRKLDDDEKKTTLISIKGGNGAVSTKEVNIVSEPGLYSLVLGSRKPEAKAFKRWVTHEVIPTIRNIAFTAPGIPPNGSLIIHIFLIRSVCPPRKTVVEYDYVTARFQN